MMIQRICSRVFIGIAAGGWLGGLCPAAVRTGLDNVGMSQELFEGKRLGVIANHTSYNNRNQYAVEAFRSMRGMQVVTLFSPEHGVQGTAEAGTAVDSRPDSNYGLPVYSLYGQTKKPTPEMLRDVDVLVFDIQDVGARFYTYVSTMALAMEAAAENGKRFVVLDRPNPLGGEQVEGPVLDPAFASFVGLYPIPVRHGMTIGELAQMINGEDWLSGGVKADLVVVPVTGWRRSMWYDLTGLPFTKPSPNIPDLETAIVYPGLCLLEGANVSEGRGTDAPFRQFGAPWLDADKLCTNLNKRHLAGASFEPVSFTPTSSKYQGQQCHGAKLTVTDRNKFEPFRTGVEIVNQVCRLHSDRFEWNAEHFDRLCGTDAIRKAITAKASIDALTSRWQAECTAFRKARAKYLLYPE